MMAPWILIFFVTMANSTTASVRVNFTSNENCAIAARELSDKLKMMNPGAEVIWSCVRS